MVNLFVSPIMIEIDLDFSKNIYYFHLNQSADDYYQCIKLAKGLFFISLKMEMTILGKKDLFDKVLLETGKKYGLTPHQVVDLIKYKITDDRTDVTFEPSINANQDFVNDCIIL